MEKVQYAILKSEGVVVKGENGSLIEVVLKAEDGQQETQQYFVKDSEKAEDVLSAAANHFNDEWMAKQGKSEAEKEEVLPSFVDAKKSI